MSLFGRVYRTFTFGESHAKGVGCLIDGFPSGFKIDLKHIQQQLNRRKPGQSSITTPRKQDDIVQCLSGLQNQVTLGCPLMFIVKNQNIKKSDYDRFDNIPRPGHADYTYMMKYGLTASSGGGRSSARETIGKFSFQHKKGRIISGALAKQYLKQNYGIEFSAWVYQIGSHSIPLSQNERYILQKLLNPQIQQKGQIKVNNVQNKKQQLVNIRCPHFETALKMYKNIEQIKNQGDSIGGVIQGCIYGLPKGLGEPVFDKIQAYLAHAMLSIPATKGFQFGSGFQGTKMKGSQHNDVFVASELGKQENKKMALSLKSNNSGGSLGGVSTGQTFVYKVAFKPVSTISKPQNSVNYDGQQKILQGKGRHDPCVLPRAPAIVDNMAAMTIMDLIQLNKIY